MINLRGNWAGVITLTLIALPFLSGAAYLGCRSLWFQYGAERAAGTVIDTTADGELTVEYLTAEGKPFSTRSGGSDYYKGYSPGDKLTVFYDPQNPEEARIDLWLEHWIAPLLLAVPGALIMLAMLLITSALRGSPFLQPPLERNRSPERKLPLERKQGRKSSPITKL